jgi:hypothetical protein
LGLHYTRSAVGVQGGGGFGHSRALFSDCTLAAGAEKNIGFYEKCGYVVKEVGFTRIDPTRNPTFTPTPNPIALMPTLTPILPQP